MDNIERQVAVMSRDLAQLKTAVEDNTGLIRALEHDMTEVKVNWVKTLNSVNVQLAETVTKLKVQTRFTILMITTLFPAQIALLWKLFFG